MHSVSLDQCLPWLYLANWCCKTSITWEMSLWNCPQPWSTRSLTAHLHPSQVITGISLRHHICTHAHTPSRTWASSPTAHTHIYTHTQRHHTCTHAHTHTRTYTHTHTPSRTWSSSPTAHTHIYTHTQRHHRGRGPHRPQHTLGREGAMKHSLAHSLSIPL